MVIILSRVRRTCTSATISFILQKNKINADVLNVERTHINDVLVQIDKFVENTLEYRALTDVTTRISMKKEAFTKWMSYLLIRNSDQTKHGSLSQGLMTQFTMGNSQYPVTMMAATDILAITSMMLP